MENLCCAGEQACVCETGKRWHMHSCSFLSHHLFITNCSFSICILGLGNYLITPPAHLSSAHFHWEGVKELGRVDAAPPAAT